jgi:hypothetical protein
VIRATICRPSLAIGKAFDAARISYLLPLQRKSFRAKILSADSTMDDIPEG